MLSKPATRGIGSPHWHVSYSTSTSENSCGCTALNMSEWKEMTKQIAWQEKQPWQLACVLEDLKCWGVWVTTCGHTAKDVTLSIAWRREVWKEEVLDGLLWKGEKVNWVREGYHQSENTLKTMLGKLLRAGGGGGGGGRNTYTYIGFSEYIDTILNWTELCQPFRTKMAALAGPSRSWATFKCEFLTRPKIKHENAVCMFSYFILVPSTELRFVLFLFCFLSPH